MELALIGTGTGVGKTQVTLLLAAALRARGRRVWLHKPVACGDWDGVSADDGRRLRAAVGDGQDPALVCPREFPEPASPHVAAAAAGVELTAMKLTAALSRCRGGGHDLLVEGAGGLLAPLTSDRLTLAELLPQWELPALLVTRPDLGTLNHTMLTVRVARAAGIRLLGLVLNAPEPVADSLAVRTAAEELIACTGLPLLARVAHGDNAMAGPALVNALLGRTFTP
jgi:dethiobiotin synthetase